MLKYVIRQFLRGQRSCGCTVVFILWLLISVYFLIASNASDTFLERYPRIVANPICVGFFLLLVLYSINLWAGDGKPEPVPRAWQRYVAFERSSSSERLAALNQLLRDGLWSEIERFARDDIVKMGPMAAGPLLGRLRDELANLASDDYGRIMSMLDQASPDWSRNARDFIGGPLISYLLARLEPCRIESSNDIEVTSESGVRGAYLPYGAAPTRDRLTLDVKKLLWSLKACKGRLDPQILERCAKLPDVGVWTLEDRETERYFSEGIKTDWVTITKRFQRLKEIVETASIRKAAEKQLDDYKPMT